MAATTTLLQMRTSLQQRGYETDTAPAQTDAINIAYRKLCGDHHWPFLEKQQGVGVNAGSFGVSLSTITDLIHVQSVRLALSATQLYDLTYQEPQWVLTNGFEDITPGVPLYWTIFDGLIWMYPRPKTAYTATIDYIYDPPDLSADGDIMVVPDIYRDVILYGALAEMAARERDWAQHDRWDGKYEHLKSRMKAQLGLLQRQNAQSVVRSGFFTDTGGALYGF